MQTILYLNTKQTEVLDKVIEDRLALHNEQEVAQPDSPEVLILKEILRQLRS